ncbi:MAG: pyridoxal-phosphate dependent enzyme, partial [Ekhidna sp.]|nr:pyridoxal-phosphate dependent enzyme [Ekhidna sp.]
LKDHVKEVFRVSEEEIIAAMKLIWERMKIVIEPSCAVPFAAILKNPKIFEGKNVGVILTGGNVDLAKLPF